MKKRNKVSIILPTYGNDRSNLDRTIGSITGQTYRNWELIIVRGDKRQIRRRQAREIYRTPRGISDAFNVGVAASGGDFLYFLGAGDYLWDKYVLEKMMRNVDSDRDWLVCGRINLVEEKGGRVVFTSEKKFTHRHLLYKMALPHQALFTSRKFFDHFGLFDTNCKYAMDYEILLRAYKKFPRLIMKNIIVAGWSSGGVGTGKLQEVMQEYHRIRIKNEIAPVPLLLLIYWLSLIRYGWKKR
jgi:glycosyltransferase involved in cell wall biosynthesis